MKTQDSNFKKRHNFGKGPLSVIFGKFEKSHLYMSGNKYTGKTKLSCIIFDGFFLDQKLVCIKKMAAEPQVLTPLRLTQNCRPIVACTVTENPADMYPTEPSDFA